MKKTLISCIVAFIIPFLVSCEKEDYRDKWVGDYSCKKEMHFWHYYPVYHGDTIVDMPQQFISWTADGTMTVEKYGNSKLRFISNMISNNDYDTTGYKPNNKSNSWGCKNQHFKDTITLEVDESGNLIDFERPSSHSSSDVGHCYTNKIEFGRYSGAMGGGSGFDYKCTR